MIYFDNNASTRPSANCINECCALMREGWGNPSSNHKRGAEASRQLTVARQRVASLAGTPTSSIIFTSGATEANDAVQEAGLREERVLVSTTAEHPAVTARYDILAPEAIVRVPVDPDGLLAPKALWEALDSCGGASLLTLQWANGETGVLQDVQTLSRVARSKGALVLIDAAQAFGRVVTPLSDTGADFVSVSGHKLHAPMGVGALFCLTCDAEAIVVQYGGGQEGGRRGGTENVLGIVGFGAACAERAETLKAAITSLARVRDTFERMVLERVEGSAVNGAGAPRVPNTTNLRFNGVDAVALVARLEARGILCSQTSACSSGSPEPSATLLAMGLSREQAFSSVRFAFAVDNTIEEAVLAADAIAEEVATLRELMGSLA